MACRPAVHHGAAPLVRYELALRVVVAIACVLCPLLAPAAPAAFAALPDGAVAGNAAVPVVAILVYHRFAQSADDSMTVRIATFEAHLAFLREHGYRIVPLADIVAWVRDRAATLPPKAVAVTVDDGHRSVYDAMMPIVLRERFPVTLFVYPSAISNAPYALTWDQLRVLKATGFFDVQSHSWWHPDFHVERRRLSPDEFRRFASRQFAHSREAIEREVGGHVDMIAWPFGIYDDELVELARAGGYVAGLTIEARRVRRTDAPLALPRFLMVDGCTPQLLGRLLGETKTGSPPGPGAQR
jgi:peptidoglycan/xylan/chitin deacetylase (PgdA/CDA1 family)